MGVLEKEFFNSAFVSYFLASCFNIGHLIWLKEKLGQWAIGLTVLGFVVNTLALVSRTQQAGHIPFANMYEFGMAFVWGIILFYLYIAYRYKNYSLGTFILPVAFVLTGIFSSFYQEARPLMPALKSNWLLFHVITAVIAYGALAISFALAMMYLWRLRIENAGEQEAFMSRLPSLETLDTLANSCIHFALPFLTLLIVTGAVWAEYAWGSYWRWDPKETWSLITWLIYGIYLHGRVSLGWRGKKAMNWVVVGFITVLFTFIGVNILLPGLHSYAL
jgi:cytochrome c-type biogenesis protein CcsB